MQAVITISLNRAAFQFEQDAHDRLKRYLADAEAKLLGNEDRAEILLDLEQAVADQCRKRMQRGQDVVTMAELAPALEEIGSVEIPGSPNPPLPRASGSSHPLEQISEGAVISGVCKGLARTASMDVTLIRVIALVLLFMTGGAMILLYAILMLLLPFAPLDPDATPVRGLPAKCREYVLLIRSKLASLTS